MALRDQADIEHPSGTRPIAGDQGERMRQEPNTGKGIYRKGAEEAEADIDIATSSSPIDLTGADGPFESGQRSTGGAEALAGHILDDNGNTFDVRVDWMDDQGNVLVTDDRSSLTGVSDVKFNLVVRSDHFEVRVVDNGGATAVHGTVNAH